MIVSNPTLVLAILALLVFAGLALEELFRRTGIPDVLVLLGLGIAAGATGFVDVTQFGGIAENVTVAPKTTLAQDTALGRSERFVSVRDTGALADVLLKNGFTEQQAWRFIQTQAMNRRLKVHQIGQMIIDGELNPS